MQAMIHHTEPDYGALSVLIKWQNGAHNVRLTECAPIFAFCVTTYLCLHRKSFALPKTRVSDPV